jgi:uncharacterized membrane protein
MSSSIIPSILGLLLIFIALISFRSGTAKDLDIKKNNMKMKIRGFVKLITLKEDFKTNDLFIG